MRGACGGGGGGGSQRPCFLGVTVALFRLRPRCAWTDVWLCMGALGHHTRAPSTVPVRGAFSPNPLFSYKLAQLSHPIRAHTCSAITRRLGGWLGASGKLSKI